MDSHRMTDEGKNDRLQEVEEKKEESRKPQIIAIGGGKGGIGKTVLTASIGAGLATLKRHVVVVDADFGGANLHTVLGIEKPSKTFYNFYHRECGSLEDILIEHSSLENFKIICGASGAMGIVNMPYYQKLKFIRHLNKFDADFVILDLGAGTSYNVLDLFLAANTGIVLVNPDPLSIIEGYNFMKQLVYRKLIKGLKHFNGPLEIIQKYAGSETFKSTATVENLLEEVTQVDTEAAKKMETLLVEFRPRLLLNMMKESDDETNGLAVKVAAKDLLSIDMDYLGAIHTDETVSTSLKEGVPFIKFDPKCQASRDLSDIIISKVLHAGRFEAIREKHLIRRTRETWKMSKKDVICSVKCIYWDECEYKNGGYPCKLQHLVQVRGFHGDD